MKEHSGMPQDIHYSGEKLRSLMLKAEFKMYKLKLFWKNLNIPLSLAANFITFL